MVCNKQTSQNEKRKAFKEEKHISAFEPRVLLIGIVFAFLSAAIGMQIVGVVGTVPNTSVLGVIFAIILGKIPSSFFSRFANLERQNLIQTICSAGAFSAGNCCFVAVATFFVLGEPSYMIYAAVACAIGTTISIFVVGKLYDCEMYPAAAPWPPGVATADAIIAGDEGGEKGKQLLQGIALGVVGSIFKIPMAGIGIVFISSIPAMAALGLGLVIRGYSPQLFNFNIGSSNIGQGFMVGAGIMALFQCVIQLFKTSGQNKKNVRASDWKPTRTMAEAKKAIGLGLGLFVTGAALIGVVSGVLSGMSAGKIVIWVVWSGLASVIAMLIVGMAAMNSGWFPGYAITTVMMTLALFMGFEPIPIVMMAGYIGSVGPCFSDMGYDLKTGWLIRGQSADPEYEKTARKEQVKIEMVGGLIGVAAVILFSSMLISQGVIPPIASTFVKTAQSVSDPAMLKELLIWAVPGILVQLIGGKWMCGVLFGTGLLLNSTKYGIAVLCAIVFRLIFGTKWMDGRKAGFVAGDGLYGFFSNVMKAFF